MAVLTRQLMIFLHKEFALDWRGIHGAPHWARVRINGLALASATGADHAVVELFSFLHDSRRASDGFDPRHGERAAQLAREHNGRLFLIDANALRLLEQACIEHSEGLVVADATVQTCWDADRLDLGRLGIRPDPARLCTEAARQAVMIDAAWRRAFPLRRDTHAAQQDE